MRDIIKRYLLKIPFVKMFISKRRYKIFKHLTNQDPRINANSIYRSVFNKDIDWDNPKDLIEKIYWLQLFTDTSLWTKCADKYRMREYVEGKGLGHLLPQNYGHWDKAEEIDFNILPDSFVLKTTNGCGQVLLVPDKTKLNISKTIKLLNQWMSIKYGFTDAQIHYSRIKPCIIAEEYLSPKSNKQDTSLTDYKVWCFHGSPEYILVVYDRVILGKHQGYSLSAYDLEWNDISNRSLNKSNIHYSGKQVPRPETLNEMIDSAKILSKDFPEVRVDFYEIEGKLYLGELTFTTGYGYHTKEFYEYLGSKIDLSKVERISSMNRPELID